MIRAEFVKDGKNQSESFETYEELDFFVKENNLIESKDPENENEYRLTSN